MVAVGGGLMAAAGLFAILGELDGYDQRMVGLAISAVFTVLGVAVTILNRSTRSANAGVALSAVGVVPLVVFLWANSDVFDRFFGPDAGSEVDPFDGLSGVITLILLSAAVLWLAGYLFGPGRRYGIYLGAALIALWLVPMNHLALSAASETFGPFSTTSSFDSGTDTSGFDSSFDSEFDPNDPSTFDSSFDSSFDEPVEPDVPDVSDPTLKLGLVSLAFGAAYLAMAFRRDRDGDARMATAFLVPALITLYAAYTFTSSHLGAVPSRLFLLAIGAAIGAVGLLGQRRLSSWVGMLTVTAAVIGLMGDLPTSPTITGLLLTIVGVAIAVAVGHRERPPATTEPTPEPEPESGPDAAVGPVTPF